MGRVPRALRSISSSCAWFGLGIPSGKGGTLRSLSISPLLKSTEAAETRDAAPRRATALEKARIMIDGSVYSLRDWLI